MKKKTHPLRAGRLALQVAVALGITLCVALGLRCFATRMQIFPAVMAGSVAWLVLWAAVTLVFGRVYCSVACPMGALMDAVARVRRMLPGRGRSVPYRFEAPWTGGRYAVLTAVAAAVVLGFSGLAALLDPYSAYARMVAAARAALWRPVALSLVSAAVAMLTLGVVAALSWRRGRYLCNTWCPVGSALSLVSRAALYKPDVDTDACVHCLRCVDACKAHCINAVEMTVDPARCVVCFDCVDMCPTGAITYTRRRYRLSTPLMQPAAPAQAAGAMQAVSHTPVLMDRRAFLRRGLVVAAGAAVGRMAAAPAAPAWAPEPLKPLNVPLPPGMPDRKTYLRRCTACGACMAACPTGVLQPAGGATGVVHALQPAMSYGEAACATDCRACTLVCPTGALMPLSLAEKRSFVVGKARIRLQNCLAYGRGRACGRCARRCPARAITMTRLPDGRRGPVVDVAACTGCGQCVQACPSTPYNAITIEGE